ncbi:MAG TPA: hypothetical protein VEA69_03200 [Tepidisphaeraceae bacterium]|nr:hypothetical protein [Tepidisphaeraceae bacterium]
MSASTAAGARTSPSATAAALARSASSRRTSAVSSASRAASIAGATGATGAAATAGASTTAAAAGAATAAGGGDVKRLVIVGRFAAPDVFEADLVVFRDMGKLQIAIGKSKTSDFIGPPSAEPSLKIAGTCHSPIRHPEGTPEEPALSLSKGSRDRESPSSRARRADRRPEILREYPQDDTEAT